MPEYERSVSLSVGADDAYRYLADPQNLTKYVATMVTAPREDGDRLRVAADVRGRHEDGEASFRSDTAAHRLEWGSLTPGPVTAGAGDASAPEPA